MTEHHRLAHQRRTESKWRKVLREYRVELIWLLLVIIGLFLVLERMSIRSSIIRWLRTSVALTVGAAGRIDDTLGAFLSRLTLSDAIGALLLVGAAVGILSRIRWRLLRSPSLTSTQCPICNGELKRIHRQRWDRVLNRFVPVRRYGCANKSCQWSGLRVHVSSGHHGSGSHTHS